MIASNLLLGDISSYLNKGFTIRPNLVMHIYKVRRGKLHNVKLYIYFDYATCRSEDCFITDKDGNFLNVEDTKIDILLEQTEEKRNKYAGFEL